MEEDVKPKDQDGVDGWGVCGWDGWVCGLGAVGASLVFGLVRGTGAFAPVLPSVVLVSRIQLAQRYRGNIATSFSAVSSSRREAMVGGTLARASAFRVGLGVSETIITPGLCLPIALVWWMGVWFGCGGRLLGIWVGTWDRSFRCGASVCCFSFKNTARATIPWQHCHFLQCSVL
jgi:hypothetical protein